MPKKESCDIRLDTAPQTTAMVQYSITAFTLIISSVKTKVKVQMCIGHVFMTQLKASKGPFTWHFQCALNAHWMHIESASFAFTCKSIGCALARCALNAHSFNPHREVDWKWIQNESRLKCVGKAAEVMWYSSFPYHTQYHEAPLKSHEGQWSTDKMSGG